MADALPSIPEGKVVLVVMAHPDDAEFGSGGTIATWAAAGKEIHYVLCTSGDKGSSDPDMLPRRLAEIRQQEQTNAAHALGAIDVTFLGWEDGVLQNTIGLRRDIVREIRRFKPDAVICQDPTQRWSGIGSLNHPDHRAAGDACLDAVYPSARDPHMFPELLVQGFQPHKVREVFVQSQHHADTWVDIGAQLDRKAAGIRAHVSQVPKPEGITERITNRSAALAQANSLPFAHAEGFKYFKMMP
jgi:LmbE family N-acetylglucosaminyl deacetylase